MRKLWGATTKVRSSGEPSKPEGLPSAGTRNDGVAPLATPAVTVMPHHPRSPTVGARLGRRAGGLVGKRRRFRYGGKGWIRQGGSFLLCRGRWRRDGAGRRGGAISTGQPCPQLGNIGGGNRLFLAAGKQKDGRTLFAPATGDGLRYAERLGNRPPTRDDGHACDASFPYDTAYALPCTPKLSR